MKAKYLLAGSVVLLLGACLFFTLSFMLSNTNKMSGQLYQTRQQIAALETQVAMITPAPAPTPMPAEKSLFVDISANPAIGAAPLSVGLTAVVAGTARGLVTYRFDCTSDGIWEMVIITTDTAYTAVGLCSYSTVGNYTATIQAERDGLGALSTVAILAQSAVPELYISVDPIAPASRTVAPGEIVEFVRFNFAAVGDTTICGLAITRDGIGSDLDLEDISLYDGATMIGPILKRLDGGEVYFGGFKWVISAYTTKALIVRGTISEAVAVGHEIRLGIRSGKSVCTDANLDGLAFPVMGETMTVR